MATGLGMGGLDVPYDECLVGMVGQIFNSKTTTKKDLIDMFHLIVKDDEIHVDVVCRLYILVSLVTFFLPRKSENVANIPCAVLDDLDSLCLYDWASCVHKHLVQSLNNSKKKIMSGRFKKSLSLSGNVVVLQAWAVERLSLHHHSSQKTM